MLTCPTHGDYEPRILPNPIDPEGKPMVFNRCSKCLVEEQDRREREKHQEKVNYLLRDANIPLKFANVTLASFPELKDATPIQNKSRSSALASMTRWIERLPKLRETGGRGLWLVLTGGVGTGKTGISCAVARALCEVGERVLYLTLPEVARYVWDAKNRGSWASQAMSELGSCDVLIVDELGTTGNSDAEVATLTEVMNLRYGRMAAMVLISNGTKEQVCASLNDRAASRLEEYGYFIPCDWPDLRKQINL